MSVIIWVVAWILHGLGYALSPPKRGSHGISLPSPCPFVLRVREMVVVVVDKRAVYRIFFYWKYLGPNGEHDWGDCILRCHPEVCPFHSVLEQVSTLAAQETLLKTLDGSVLIYVSLVTSFSFIWFRNRAYWPERGPNEITATCHREQLFPLLLRESWCFLSSVLSYVSTQFLEISEPLTAEKEKLKVVEVWRKGVRELEEDRRGERKGDRERQKVR